MKDKIWDWDDIRKAWPKKSKGERFIFEEIYPVDRISIGTGGGEPQRLASALFNYVKENPKAFHALDDPLEAAIFLVLWR